MSAVSVDLVDIVVVVEEESVVIELKSVRHTVDVLGLYHVKMLLGYHYLQ